MGIRLSIIEDDVEIATFLQTILRNSNSINLISIHNDAETFINQCDQLFPDVVLVDIELPGINGIECVRLLKPKSPNIQFLIFSVFEDHERLFEALCAGATGYLTKNSSSDKLHNSIEEIFNGGSPMSPEIARMVVKRFNGAGLQNTASEMLTIREREILTLLSKGLRYKEIAAMLFISIETVRKHARNTYVKLQVSSRTDALNKVFGK